MFSLIFLRLFEDFSNAVKSFYLILNPVETVFFGNPYFSATFLLETPFFKSLKTWHFSAKVLTANFILTAMLKQRKNAVKKIQTLSKHSNLNIQTKVRDKERKTV